MTTRLTVVTANTYVFNREVEAMKRRLVDTHADVIGVQEAYHEPRQLPGYLRLGCHYAGDRAGREVPIFLLDVHDYQGHGAYLIKRDLGGKVTPARWITWARFRHAGGQRFALVNTHLDAALQRPDGTIYDAPRVHLAAQHMRAVLDEVRRHRESGYAPMVTADFNYRLVGSVEAWRWSPHRALPRARLQYLPHRVDGIAVPKDAQVRTVDPVILPGSDHKGLRVTFDL